MFPPYTLSYINQHHFTHYFPYTFFFLSFPPSLHHNPGRVVLEWRWFSAPLQPCLVHSLPQHSTSPLLQPASRTSTSPHRLCDPPRTPSRLPCLFATKQNRWNTKSKAKKWSLALPRLTFMKLATPPSLLVTGWRLGEGRAAAAAGAFHGAFTAFPAGPE